MRVLEDAGRLPGEQVRDRADLRRLGGHDVALVLQLTPEARLHEGPPVLHARRAQHPEHAVRRGEHATLVVAERPGSAVSVLGPARARACGSGAAAGPGASTA